MSANSYVGQKSNVSRSWPWLLFGMWMFWDIDDQFDVTVWYQKHGPTDSSWHNVCQTSDSPYIPWVNQWRFWCIHYVFIIKCTVHTKYYTRHVMKTLSTLLAICEGNPLQWRYNDHDGVSNHRRLNCFLNCLFRCRSKKASKLRAIGLCGEN